MLHPTLSGQIDRSATLRFLTPWTLRRSSRTPCLTILLPSFGAMEQVYISSALITHDTGRLGRKVATYTKTMPSRLHMSLNPLLNMLNILLTILQILIHMLAITIQQASLRSTARLDGHRPGAVLDAGCEAAGEGVGFGGCEVHVLCAGRRVKGVEGVHGLYFTSICFHATRCFTWWGISNVIGEEKGVD